MDGRRHWITWTLNKLVETITASLIPRSRQQDLWDLAEAQPPAYAFQAFDYTIHAIWDTTERALFPAFAIDRGPPPPEKRRKRFYNLPEGQRRSVLLFIIASFAYSGAAVRMLPQSAHIPFFAVLLQAALLGFALRLQRAALVPGPAGRPALQIGSIDPGRYSKDLRRAKDLVILGEFSPSKSPLRAGVIALMVMFMFFMPAYPVLRWFAGDSLPAGVGWTRIVGAFMAALFLVAWFLVIWKSGRLAANVLQKEIDALDAAGKKR